MARTSNIGLNLTNYTLWGILHHSSLKYTQGRVSTDYLEPDYISQYNNDLLISKAIPREAWSFGCRLHHQAPQQRITALFPAR